MLKIPRRLSQAAICAALAAAVAFAAPLIAAAQPSKQNLDGSTQRSYRPLPGWSTAFCLIRRQCRSADLQGGTADRISTGRVRGDLARSHQWAIRSSSGAFVREAHQSSRCSPSALPMASQLRIPGEVGHRFRDEAGHRFRRDVGHSDLKSATLWGGGRSTAGRCSGLLSVTDHDERGSRCQPRECRCDACARSCA